jgi:hypothetical protein
MEFIQVSGMAFDDAIPWTDNDSGVSTAIRYLRFFGLDMWPAAWDMSFGGRLFITSSVWLFAEYACKLAFVCLSHTHTHTHTHSLSLSLCVCLHTRARAYVRLIGMLYAQI